MYLQELLTSFLTLKSRKNAKIFHLTYPDLATTARSDVTTANESNTQSYIGTRIQFLLDCTQMGKDGQCEYIDAVHQIGDGEDFGIGTDGKRATIIGNMKLEQVESKHTYVLLFVSTAFSNLKGRSFTSVL